MSGEAQRRADFDGVARPYRWLEYLTLGRALEQCRFRLLPQVRGRRQALVLGDGDGRAAARLLADTPALAVDAVDTSAVMLELLRSRCREAVAAGRLRTYCEAAEEFAARLVAGDRLGLGDRRYDLVTTHFFLDCLSGAAVEELVRAVGAAMTEDGVWVVSEFRIPEGWLRWPATVLVRGLYAAFGVLTGLEVRALPDYGAAMEAAGLRLLERRLSLGGILTSELWGRG